jgi:hypothetical protein
MKEILFFVREFKDAIVREVSVQLWRKQKKRPIRKSEPSQSQWKRRHS